MSVGEATEDRWERSESALLRRAPRVSTPIPAYAGRSVANLAASLYSAFRGPPPSTLLPTLDAAIDPFRRVRGARTTVVGILDGFGWLAFREYLRGRLPPRAPSWAPFAEPITTVFPTTTTCALLSLSTGVAPGRHGIVGYRQWVPRWNRVADILRMAPAWTEQRDTLGGARFVRRSITDVPTLFERGLRCSVVSREEFESSRFTRLIYSGAEFVGYATQADLFGRLTRLLRAPRPPRLILAYWDGIDHGHHVRGPDPELFRTELALFQTGLSELAGRLPRDVSESTRVILTGDHGLVAAAPQRTLRIERLPKLLRLLRYPPTGDRRGTFFAARAGRREALGSLLRTLVPRGTILLDSAQAIDSGLFGPPPHHGELRERIGDFLALPPSPAALSYHPPRARRHPRHLFGTHGGVEPAELLVPLIGATLDQLGGRPEKR